MTTGQHCYMVQSVALYTVLFIFFTFFFFLLVTSLFWFLFCLFLTSVVWLRLSKHLHPSSHSCTAGLILQILDRLPGNILYFLSGWFGIELKQRVLYCPSGHASCNWVMLAMLFQIILHNAILERIWQIFGSQGRQIMIDVWTWTWLKFVNA